MGLSPSQPPPSQGEGPIEILSTNVEQFPLLLRKELGRSQYPNYGYTQPTPNSSLAWEGES